MDNEFRKLEEQLKAAQAEVERLKAEAEKARNASRIPIDGVNGVFFAKTYPTTSYGQNVLLFKTEENKILYSVNKDGKVEHVDYQWTKSNNQIIKKLQAPDLESLFKTLDKS